MTTWALALITFAVLVVAGAFILALEAIRRAANRAETVLMLVEREIRPTASELLALADELRGLSRQASRELERIAGGIEDLSKRIGRLVAFVSGMTRVGQFVGAASGVRKGVDVFISRLRSGRKP
ncbi:MAG: hypothetical protein ACE5JD_14005 [Candidatus Methylomirabilia bacterium]